MFVRRVLFTPLEKATDFSRWSSFYKAVGSLKLPSARAVRERNSLMGFTATAVFFTMAFYTPWLLAVSAPGSGAPAGLIGSSDTLLFTGSFTYSIPLEAPPGTHGIQPNLTLIYNSSAGNGWCGVGWDLSFGTIQRSIKNGMPHYDTTDTFIFISGGQAQELFPLGNGEYRVKIDSSFMKFKYESDYWTVWDKSGTRYFFGYMADVLLSRTVNPVNGQTYSWSLSNVIDTNNNEIYFKYIHDQNQIYPEWIEYNHHGAETPPMRKIIFNLEDRTYYGEIADTITNNRGGFSITTAKRLKSIEMKVADNIIRTYECAYTPDYPDIYTKRSLLSSVKIVSPLGASLPATTFAYQSISASWLEDINNWTTMGTDTGFYFADLNGDGKTDVANNLSGYAGLDVYFSTGYGLGQVNHWLDDTAKGDFYFQDFTGDGLLDVACVGHQVETIDGKTGHIMRMWKNTGASLEAPVIWLIFLSPAPVPKLHFGEFNGDGKADIAMEINGGLELRFANKTGTGCLNGGTWSFPNSEGEYFLFDFSGDGMTDVARRITDNSTDQTGLRVWFNTDTGFADKGAWLDNNTSSYKLYVFDANGDGLLDITHFSYKSDHKLNVYLNTGSGVQYQGAYTLNSNAKDIFLGDFNGDGLTDVAMNSTEDNPNYYGLIVWLNKGNGFAFPETWTGEQTGPKRFQLFDFNGDGKTDVAKYNSEKGSGAGGLDVMLANGPIPNLLSLVTNPMGGATAVTYRAASFYPNRFLPFALQVVEKIEINDGFLNQGGIIPFIWTLYSYRGGYYDINAKEFLGFGEVEASYHGGKYTLTKFLQEQGHKVELISDDKLAYVNPYKGKILTQESYQSVVNSTGTLLAQTTHTYGCTTGEGISSFPTWYFPHLIRTDSYTYDGGIEKHIGSIFSYDSYGNVTTAKTLGDVAVGGDDVSTVTEYEHNQEFNDKYIVALPRIQQVKDSADTVKAQTAYQYDTNGNLITKTSGLGPTSSTTMTYDAYGNVATGIDGNGNTTTTTYDEQYHTFPVTIANAKGHVQSATYDPGTSNVLTETGANGQTTTYTYDNFGRLLTVLSPIDTAGAPSVVYNYYDTEFPRKVLSRTKQKGGAIGDNSTLNYIRVYQFYDGLGRVAQTKTETVSNWGNWIISDCKEYNSRGLVAKAYDAFFPVNNPPYIIYTYDALDRVIQQDKPDGSFTTTSFTGWTETKTDENGHSADYYKDAYGRISKVVEHISGQPQETQYTYDTLGNLVKIVNAIGETTTISYDSLGRKTGMTDPKMGNWSYTYDANGNLISQTDGKGQTTTLEYDSLNRITKKTYPNTTAITYEYDTEGESYSKGRLIKVTDLSGYTKFSYDSMGRVTQTEKAVIDGAEIKTYTTISNYNASGQQTKLICPNTAEARSFYDAGGNLLAVHDGNTIYAGTMQYNHHKQLLRIDYGNGLSTGYKYNLGTSRLTKLISGGDSGGSAPLPPPPDDPPGTPPSPPDDPGIDPPPPDDGGGGYNPPPGGGGPGGNEPPGGGDGGGGGGGDWYWPDPTFIRHNPKDFKAFEEFMKTLKLKHGEVKP